MSRCKAYQCKNHKNVIREEASSIDLSGDNAEADSRSRQDKCKTSRSDNYMAEVIMIVSSRGLRGKRHVENVHNKTPKQLPSGS